MNQVVSRSNGPIEILNPADFLVAAPAELFAAAAVQEDQNEPFSVTGLIRKLMFMVFGLMRERNLLADQNATLEGRIVEQIEVNRVLNERIRLLVTEVNELSARINTMGAQYRDLSQQNAGRVRELESNQRRIIQLVRDRQIDRKEIAQLQLRNEILLKQNELEVIVHFQELQRTHEAVAIPTFLTAVGAGIGVLIGGPVIWGIAGFAGASVVCQAVHKEDPKTAVLKEEIRQLEERLQRL